MSQKFLNGILSESDLTLVDGLGASPRLILKNSSDETWEIFNGTHGVLNFYEGTNLRLSFAQGGNATFAGKVNVQGSPPITANSNFDDLVITDSAHAGISIFSGNTSDGAIYFGDTDANNLGQIKYLHSSNSMTFSTSAGNASLTLDSGSAATFAGDVKGVTFNSIENAASGGFPGSKDYLLAGTGDRGGGLIINDISGARHAITAGGYDLTFYKETDDGSGTVSHDIWMRANATDGAGNVNTIDFFKETNFSGNATFTGDVVSDGLYVNSSSAVSGTQVAIVQDGSQNLQRWGTTSDGSSQASYRFRIDQDMKFIANSGSGDNLTIFSDTGNLTTSGAISASNLSGTNTGDQDLSGYATTGSIPTDFVSKANGGTFDGNIAVQDISMGSADRFTHGSYLELSYGASNTSQFTFNADYDGGQTGTYTPNYSGNSSAGMSVVKMAGGGIGGLDFYVKNHGTTSGSHNIGTFTKILELNQNGISTFGGNVSVGGNSLTAGSLDINGTADFTGKVDFQGDAAIEGGSGYGVFKGYSLNDNHFISVRGIVANSSTLSITGGHQTTFVEHADAANEGWYFKSFTTGTYREIARIDGTNQMFLGGNKVWNAGNDGSGSGLDADTLDGNHASAFALSSVVNQTDFVSKASGGTFTGDLNVHTGAGTGALSVGRTSDQAIKLHVDDTVNTIFAYQDSDGNGDHQFILRRDFQGTGASDFKIQNGATSQLLINKDGQVTIPGNAIISGNLTVDGTTTTLNTTTVEVEDNILQLNTTQGSPDTATAATSGISVYRGDGVTQASLIFDDADDRWDLTNHLRIGGELTVDGHVQASILYNTSDLRVLNKAGSNWLTFAARNTSATEAVYDLANVGTISTSGDINTSGDVHIDEGSTSTFQTTNKLRFGNTSWNNNIGIESYWMRFGCNQNEGFKFEDSTSNMLLQLNGSNSTSGNGAFSATFKGSIIPAADASLTLGTGSLRWNFAYINNALTVTDGNFNTTTSFKFNKGLVVEGSVDSGSDDMGYYQSAGTNIILKGDSAGRSGIFFESEKDGTNINDPSDYGFIQFHSYGYGNTSGEANNLVIGVANDSTDKVILQAPYNGGVLIGYNDATSGTGLTLSEVIHSNSSSYNASQWDAAEANVNADWNATSGDAQILNKPTILVPEFFEEKFAYQSNDSNTVYTPMVKGGLYGTNAVSVTGAIRIDLPAYQSAGMINFYVDIYEYNTGDTVTFRISGYAYSDTDATWHNCSVINLSDNNNDYNVRFISDTTNSKQCVTIGEVDTSWTYPQVLVRDAFSGFQTSESEWLASWDITFVTSFVGTVRHTFSDNLPYADWDRLEGKPTLVPFSGSWNGANMPGSRFGGYQANSGEVVFQQDNPSSGRMSIMTDGNFHAGENGGFYSLYASSSYNSKGGFYADASGTLQFVSDGVAELADFQGRVIAGNGSQAANNDAMLTLNATQFSGLDIKSARTEGNIGGLRYFDTASDTVPQAQFLVEVDGSYNFYNGTNGAQLRLKIDSAGDADFEGTVKAPYITASNPNGNTDGSAQEVARFVNVSTGATSSYMYIGASSGTDWRLGKNINGTAGNTNFAITKHSGTTLFFEIDGVGNTTAYGSAKAAAIKTDSYQDGGGNIIFLAGNATTGASRSLNLRTSGSTGDPSASDDSNSTGITWGQRSDSNPYYMIYPNLENWSSSGNYSKLTLAWHTGIKIGADKIYGGTRFYNQSPDISGAAVIMNVGVGNDNVSVVNNLIVGGSLNVGPGPSRFTDQQNAGSRLELYNNRQDASNVEVYRIAAYNSVEVAGVHFYRGSGGDSGYSKIFSKKNNASNLQEVVQFGTNDALTSTFSGDVTIGTGNLSLISNGTISTGGYWHILSAANGNGYLDAGGTIFIRDKDDSNADRITIDTATGYVGMGIANTNNQRLTLAEADSNGSHIKMNNSRSGGGYWVVGVGDTNSNSSITDPGGIFFYNGSTKLKLAANGDATFAGNIKLSGGKTVTHDNQTLYNGSSTSTQYLKILDRATNTGSTENYMHFQLRSYNSSEYSAEVRIHIPTYAGFVTSYGTMDAGMGVQIEIKTGGLSTQSQVLDSIIECANLTSTTDNIELYLKITPPSNVTVVTVKNYADADVLVDTTQSWTTTAPSNQKRDFLFNCGATRINSTVIGRPNLEVEGNILLTGPVTTTNQGRMIDFTGFDKEGITDFSDRAFISHTTNIGGHAGSVLQISSENDVDDGIAFITNASSLLKHNGDALFSEGHLPTWSEIESKPTTFTPSQHTQAATTITSGVLDAARLPVNLQNVASTLDNSGIYFRSANEGISGEGWCTGHYAYNHNDGFLFLNRSPQSAAVPVFHIGGYNNAGYGGYATQDSLITLTRSDGTKTTGSGYAHKGLSSSIYYTNIIKTTTKTVFNDAQGYHEFTGNVSTPTGSFSVGSASDTNQRNLHLHAYVANKSSTLKCTDGNLHIDSADGHALYLNYYAGASTNINFGNSNNGVCGTLSSSGLLRVGNDVVAYYSFSDKRLKKDIKTTENNLDKILSLRPVEYKWKEGPREGVKEIGLIAQEVEKVVPEVVRVQSRHDDENYDEGVDYKQVDYEHLVSTLIGAMQEQQDQINDLKKEIQTLKSK